MKETAGAGGSSKNDEFRLEDFLPFRLAVAAEAVSRLIAKLHLAQSGLTMPEWRLIAAIGCYGVLSPTVAGERTSMDKVKISRAAASLVARGLIKQNHDPDDGRGRLLRLTRKGNNIYAGIAPTARSIEETLAQGLTKTEISALRANLGKLLDHVQAIQKDDGDSSGG